VTRVVLFGFPDEHKDVLMYCGSVCFALLCFALRARVTYSHTYYCTWTWPLGVKLYISVSNLRRFAILVHHAEETFTYQQYRTSTTALPKERNADHGPHVLKFVTKTGLGTQAVRPRQELSPGLIGNLLSNHAIQLVRARHFKQ